MATIATICGNPRDPVSVYTTAVVDRALEGKVTPAGLRIGFGGSVCVRPRKHLASTVSSSRV